MSLALSAHKTVRAAKAAELGMQWVDYSGPWEEFVDQLEGEQLDIVQLWPKEFQAVALERAKKIDTWVENRVPDLLEAIFTIATQATKVVGKEVVDDNTARLNAAKFLIERCLGKAPETPLPTGELAGEVNQLVERRMEIMKALGERGGRITERSIEIDGSTEARAPAAGDYHPRGRLQEGG